MCQRRAGTQAPERSQPQTHADQNPDADTGGGDPTEDDMEVEREMLARGDTFG